MERYIASFELAFSFTRGFYSDVCAIARDAYLDAQALLVEGRVDESNLLMDAVEIWAFTYEQTIRN